jgi:hypothetical protein
MSKPFGIDFGHEGIASTFATCISCFNYALKEGTNDWLKLRLSVVRLRLTRWGAAVDVYNNPKLGQIAPDPEDIESAKDILVDMVAIFESLAHGTEEPTEDLPSNQTAYVGQLLMTLENIASERSTGTSLLTHWPLVSGQWSARLVTACSEHITMLYEYFPAARRQRELRYHERQIIKPIEALTVLESAEIGIEDNNGGIVGNFNANIVTGVQGNMTTWYLTAQK